MIEEVGTLKYCLKKRCFKRLKYLKEYKVQRIEFFQNKHYVYLLGYLSSNLIKHLFNYEINA